MVTLLEQLVDDLDSDLANRRRELIDIRLMVSASTGHGLTSWPAPVMSWHMPIGKGS